MLERVRVLEAETLVTEALPKGRKARREALADRKMGAGARFKTADLVGLPLRVVVGRDAKDRRVEWKLRAGAD